jgi:acetyl esterase
VGAVLLVAVGTGALTGFHAPPHPIVQSDPTATGSELTTTEIIGIRTFTPPSGITVTADVVYGTLADGTILTLDVCSPPADTPVASVPISLRPAVVSIHGGSWARGDKASSDWRGVCLWLASAGFVAYSVNYRLTPDALFPAAIDDVSRAVEWIRDPANARAFGIDPTRIGAFGGSAGGNLAALLGARGSGGWTAGSRVASVAVLSAPFDLREPAVAHGEAQRRNAWTTASDTGPVPAPAPAPALGTVPTLTGDLRRITLRYLGCSTLADCAPARAASATTEVDADDPPVFLATAANEFMPLTQATEFASALERAGVAHTLVEVAGSAHSIGLLDEPMRAAVAAFLHSTLGR